MIARPGLAFRVLEAGSLTAWSGRPARGLHDSDAMRWQACLRGARLVVGEVTRPPRAVGSHITTRIKER